MDEGVDGRPGEGGEESEVGGIAEEGDASRCSCKEMLEIVAAIELLVGL